MAAILDKCEKSKTSNKSKQSKSIIKRQTKPITLTSTYSLKHSHNPINLSYRRQLPPHLIILSGEREILPTFTKKA